MSTKLQQNVVDNNLCTGSDLKQILLQDKMEVKFHYSYKSAEIVFKISTIFFTINTWSVLYTHSTSLHIV